MPHRHGYLKSQSTRGAVKAANVPKLQFVIPACWQTALQDNELDPICLAFKHWKPSCLLHRAEQILCI